MQIYGPTQIHGPQSLPAPHAPRMAQPAARTEPSYADELQLSDAAQIAARMQELPEIRSDRVEQIRAAIADGTYETDEKLEIALSRLLDEIG